jgi:hypothetical protein
MPKAARAQVASPPAGTALARAIRGLPPGPRPTKARFGGDVTTMETIVNEKETNYFQPRCSPLAGQNANRFAKCKAVTSH